MSQVSSPCIQLCIIDPPSGLCQGCGRSLGEIGSWSSLEEPKRLAIMRSLAERMAQFRVDQCAGAVGTIGALDCNDDPHDVVRKSVLAFRRGVLAHS